MKKCPYCAEEIQDEAIVCKHCGRDLEKPPAVSAPQPKKRSGVAAGCFVILAVAAVALVGWIVSQFQSPTPSAAPFSAQVSRDFSHLFIKNQGAQEWRALEVRVGDVIGGYRFTYPGSVAPGQEVQLPLTAFLTKDGERFNPTARAAVEVWVHVVTPQGSSDWHSWRFAP